MRLKWQMVAGYVGGLNVATRVLRRGRQEGSSSREEIPGRSGGTEPCALKIRAGQAVQECRLPLEARKAKEHILPQVLQKDYSSANTSILARKTHFVLLAYRIVKIINLCCFKPLSLLVCYCSNK